VKELAEKLPSDVSNFCLSQSYRVRTFRAISIHFTLLLFLAFTLFAPFISHLAGYCDKRITRFSPRENISRAVRYARKKILDIKLKVLVASVAQTCLTTRFYDWHVFYFFREISTYLSIQQHYVIIIIIIYFF